MAEPRNPDELDVEQLAMTADERRAMRRHDDVCDQLGALANDFEAKTKTFKALQEPERIQDIIFAQVFYEKYLDNRFHEEQVQNAREQYRKANPGYVQAHPEKDMPPESELGPIPEYPLKGRVETTIEEMKPFMLNSFAEMQSQVNLYSKQLRLIRDVFCRTRF